MVVFWVCLGFCGIGVFADLCGVLVCDRCGWATSLVRYRGFWAWVFLVVSVGCFGIRWWILGSDWFSGWVWLFAQYVVWWGLGLDALFSLFWALGV